MGLAAFLMSLFYKHFNPTGFVQEHKGEIRVETEDGEFTEFVVRLPKNG